MVEYQVLFDLATGALGACVVDMPGPLKYKHNEMLACSVIGFLSALATGLATVNSVALWCTVVPLTFVLSLIVGSQALGQWQAWLLYRNASSFPTSDPQFHRNVGYYVFTLPWLRFVQSWLFSALVGVLILTAVAHLVWGGIRPEEPGLADKVTPQGKAHLSVLLGLVVLDLRRAPEADLRRIPGPQWYRLQRAVEPADLALLVETPRPSVPSAQLRFNLTTSHAPASFDLERPSLAAGLAPVLQRQRLSAAG
mgnify:CR=1 FL=1